MLGSHVKKRLKEIIPAIAHYRPCRRVENYCKRTLVHRVSDFVHNGVLHKRVPACAVAYGVYLLFGEIFLNYILESYLASKRVTVRGCVTVDYYRVVFLYLFKYLFKHLSLHLSFVSLYKYNILYIILQLVFYGEIRLT